MNQGAWYKLQSTVMCAEGNGGTRSGVTEAAGTQEWTIKPSMVA